MALTVLITMFQVNSCQPMSRVSRWSVPRDLQSYLWTVKSGRSNFK